MIFAGDFGQLPPVSAKPLYSADEVVAPIKHNKMSIQSQKNTIGKIIWQQVNTVVILKQNMRQTADTEEDIKFRTALTNMRFASCTKEDLQYLESRTISKRPGRPSFECGEFSDVSIITAFNAQKDKINELGSARFAQAHGQELTAFFSNDTLADNVGDTERKSKNFRGRDTVKIKTVIPAHRQQQLWDAQPSFTSAHIPGKLNLCIGLPVMIRKNDATELCITRGQEARVVGWEEGVGNHDQRILDTLFVELIDPPRTVQIPDLPSNVVALSKIPQKIWCSLPDDMGVQITREQVHVLPNFAMTDYASPGKTRAINVVDLNNCKDHFSYYTALSRSSTSAGTIILQGMDTFKITKGIHGSLRQEFRELELLNEITRLRWENELPATRQRCKQKRTYTFIPGLER
ncbi:hypothetical protein DFH08DRAFT_712897 [Mycena albidolilacea]|uniref:ATP-dependent DNA helicase n=1 Tax=Mycena albidolilacea TaxID=1033008 RepID=A0AAD6ZGY8_9AGAR|nr:hypothetical protein DFH08DRAFT_712897 [Mycena albidolilacea]